ncbi:MAG TPA: potassium transporter Kup [Dongiaceae bacterium]|nr:potassium transporter Kup [Dongiaceae bacterium]
MTTQVSVERSRRELATLSMAALGVVYGDIGTSPLYTLRECFAGHHPMPLTQSNVLGILSLIFWSLIIVVTLKYVAFIMRADNNGEGGVLALIALIGRTRIARGGLRSMLIVAGVFGAALFYGDGVITPAISVMSAVEGLKVVAPGLDHYVIPITITVLVLLFMVQRSGTSRVGAFFGPVMMVWFGTLGVLGVLSIVEHPSVLTALNPWHAVMFFLDNGLASFLVFGAVVLAVTGGEALYADMGHFGRIPIRLAWLGLVLPALTLNYFGQGALLLYEPGAIDNPFYHLAPDWFQWPLLGLATCATVIASQAVISGVFSVTRQAVQLGFWPRTNIKHTSTKEIGQIYIPQMNWFLLVAIILLVLGFQSSSNLAAAYGIAVTAAMMVDTLLACVVARRLWNWHPALVLGMGSCFFILDFAFLGSNMLKILDGGWFPLTIGALMLTLMLTWRRGRRVLFAKLEQETMPLEPFADSLMLAPPTKVPGTAIFMTSTPDRVPHALLHNLKHNKVMHERIVLLNINTQEVPVVPRHQRFKVQEIKPGFYVIRASYGFKESPDVPLLLQDCESLGLHFEMMDTSFFLSRERLIPSAQPAMPPVLDRIFAWMSRNTMNATDFFNIPTNRVVELGTQIEI